MPFFNKEDFPVTAVSQRKTSWQKTSEPLKLEKISTEIARVIAIFIEVHHKSVFEFNLPTGHVTRPHQPRS